MSAAVWMAEMMWQMCHVMFIQVSTPVPHPLLTPDAGAMLLTERHSNHTNLWVWASALHGMYESFCELFFQLFLYFETDPEP